MFIVVVLKHMESFLEEQDPGANWYITLLNFEFSKSTIISQIKLMYTITSSDRIKARLLNNYLHTQS